MLSVDEVKRYSRQLMLPELGAEGQQKLKDARVLIAGAGGLGSAASIYLAAAGIGTIGVADHDNIDITNLHRQILYTNSDIGKKKCLVAKWRLSETNPDIAVTAHDIKLSAENVTELIKDYGIIIDGTDNFEAKYAINDACIQLNKPDISASIVGFEGQASVFVSGSCYRCLVPRPPVNAPSCATSGVLGILPGIIGSIQATEAIKLITGKGEPLIGKLLIFDALKMDFRKLTLKKNPNCPLCSS